MGRDNFQGRGGRGNQGQSGGRGRGGNKKQETKPNKPTYKTSEMKFSPYGAAHGKSPTTFETVKDHIINTIQKSYKHGQDIADSLINMEEMDMEDNEPQMGTADSEGTTPAQLRTKQKAMEVKYQIDYTRFCERQEAYKENMIKAYALIYGNFCTESMQTRLQQQVNFQDEIRNNPIELLKNIQILMHDPVRGRYPYATVTDAFKTLIFTRQNENEHILDYSKKFKENRDVLKSYIGDEMFHAFVEKTADYRASDTTNEQRDTMKRESFNAWSAYLLLKNADQAKYGGLINHMQTQYAMGNNQYPKNVSKAVDIMSNYKFDNSKKPYHKKDDKKQQPKKEEDKKETSFAQTNKKDYVCFCCGKKGHGSYDCPEKGTKKFADWAVKKGLQYLQSEDEKGDKEKEEKSDSSPTPTKSSLKSPSATKRVGWSALQMNLLHEKPKPSDENNNFNQLKDKIILDNGSTMSIFGNPDLVTNIRDANTTLQMATNAGTQTTTQIADVPGYGTVWYDQRAIANIFGLKDMKDKGYEVTYDSNHGDTFQVHMEGKTIEFTCNKEGLYEFEVSDDYKEEIKKQQSQPSNYVSTVEENKQGFTQRQFEKAKAARELYHNLGSPTIENFKALLRMNTIKNNPITLEDVNNAEAIFGPAMSTLKGKTTRSTPKPVLRDEIDLPKEIKDINHELDLCMDIMFVNELPMLTTIDTTIKFCGLIPLQSRTHEEIFSALDQVLRFYNKAGFYIKTIFCDGEFKSMMDKVSDELDIQLNYTNAQEHVPQAERNNRTIKEQIRAALHRLPYKKIPKTMIKYLAMVQTNLLNLFPVKGGVSKYFSPRAILTNETIDYNKHLSIPFGSYVQASNENKPTNTNLPRTIDAIYLRPHKSLQGGHELFDLATGRVITRGKVKVIPVTSMVIQAVEKLAEDQGIKEYKFKNRYGQAYQDADWIEGVEFDEEYDEIEDDPPNPPFITTYDGEYNPDEENDEYSDEDDEEEIIFEQEHEPLDENEVEQLFDDTMNDMWQEQANPNQHQEENEENNEETDEYIQEDKDNMENEENIEQIEEIIEQPPPETTNQPTLRRSTRTHTPVDRYSPTFNKRQYFQLEFKDQQILEHCHNMAHQYQPSNQEIYEYETEQSPLIAKLIGDINHNVNMKGKCFAQQYMLPRGLKIFGSKGKEAAIQELTQLCKRNCFSPISIKDMTRIERQKAQEALMFLSEKKDGTIKRRMVYNGKPTQEWMTREDVASPTAATESVLLTAAIDAMEGRDIMTSDIPNAFIQAEMPMIDNGHEKVIMKISGPLVELLIDINPHLYGPMVVFENGRRIIYVWVLRAIYGMLIAALLWYKKFKTKLEGVGFIFNPYDPCVANRDIDGDQQTIIFHVDDVKSSHINEEVNTEFENWLNMEFGEHAKVTTRRGKIHDYLGMQLNYENDGEVIIDMKRYVQDMLHDFPIQFRKEQVATTPASEKIFITGMGKPLENTRREIFHTFVAKGLFLSKRARPDIQQAIAVLTTRVKEPNESDWQKLIRLMKYLNGTVDKVLTLKIDDITIIKWYVDASFAVHDDFKSHTGAIMTMGKGAIEAISRKQKLNTRSSTESELVSVDDISTMILWTKLFLQHQGYNIEKNIIFQDNKSTILLENNGRKSAGKRSRALNIRYFFISDQVERGNVQVEYCPSETMVGDLLTKPLQGTKFLEFRDIILGEK